MAKANLVLPSGTKVRIEGTADEVATLLEKCSFAEPEAAKSPGAKKAKKTGTTSIRRAKKSKPKGPVSLITQLAHEGFFKTKRLLPEIQKKLEEQGHIYAQPSLSPAVLSLTKRKVLRRLKDKERWAYVRGSADI